MSAAQAGFTGSCVTPQLAAYAGVRSGGIF
jgi:hypothetical protein